MKEIKNAIIYARYSSHGQNEQSIDQQFNVCEKYAERNGCRIVNRYSNEAKNGTNDERPDFQRMIFDSYTGAFQYVIVIISEELFNQVQELMNKKKKAPARAKAVNEKYILSSLTKCGYCGRTVTGISGTSKTGKRHYYYCCSSQNNKIKCELKSNRKDELEDLVVKKTLKLLTLERIEDISKQVVDLCKKERENKSGLKALEISLNNKKNEERNLLEALKSGKAQEILLNELDKIGVEIKEIELEIARECTKYPILTVEKVRFFMEKFTRGDVHDFYFREKLVETFVNKIEVYNDKITVSYNVQDGDFVDYSTICFSSNLAGAEGLEPSARGFGDRCSTN